MLGKSLYIQIIAIKTPSLSQNYSLNDVCATTKYIKTFCCPFYKNHSTCMYSNNKMLKTSVPSPDELLIADVFNMGKNKQ